MLSEHVLLNKIHTELVFIRMAVFFIGAIYLGRVLNAAYFS